MRELIARLEAATGPDRELDAAIAEAAGLHPERIGDALYETDGKPDWKGRWPRSGRLMPRYTDSIDAALTLVPEGYEWFVGFDEGAPIAFIFPPLEYSNNNRSNGATPAIAVCSAALRAREEANA